MDTEKVLLTLEKAKKYNKAIVAGFVLMALIVAKALGADIGDVFPGFSTVELIAYILALVGVERVANR